MAWQDEIVDDIREDLRHKYYPDNSGLPDNMIDFGFHYANQMEIVKTAVRVLELYKKWPNEGGYFEQNMKLVTDMVRYKQLENHYERTEFNRNK